LLACLAGWVWLSAATSASVAFLSFFGNPVLCQLEGWTGGFLEYIYRFRRPGWLWSMRMRMGGERWRFLPRYTSIISRRPCQFPQSDPLQHGLKWYMKRGLIGQSGNQHEAETVPSRSSTRPFAKFPVQKLVAANSSDLHNLLPVSFSHQARLSFFV
jgi:hypothetical protein